MMQPSSPSRLLLAVTPSLLMACGSSDSIGPGPVPVPVPSQPSVPGGKGTKPGAADGSQAKVPRLLRSDISEAMVAPCTKGQAFARGLCWDEVHFRPTGVFLSRPGETWAFFENGKQVSTFIQSGHVYLGPSTVNDGTNHSAGLYRNVGVAAVKDWLNFLPTSPDESASPMAGRVSGDYAFLPDKIGVWSPNEARSLEVAKVTDATFRLSSSVTFADPGDEPETLEWPLQGTVEICGQTIQLLALKQADIESACKTGPLGDTYSAAVKVPHGDMFFDLYMADGDIPTERKPLEISYALKFTDEASQ